MQMFMRLLLIILITVFSTSCAKPPVVKLDDVRNIVAHAYASGAAQYAPGEYQLASSALQAAEQQVKNGKHRKALRTLDLAQRYSAEALNLTIEMKAQLAAEQKRVAEENRLEELRTQRELERQRQADLKEKLELKKQPVPVTPRKKPAPPVVAKTTLPPEPPQPIAQVIVQSGENLGMLAARLDVYGDALLWPLIYKANRDQIKDPREIFPGQVFVIPRDKSKDDAEAARREAQELDLF